MKPARSPRSLIEMTPMLGVCAGLVLAALPLADKVAPWSLALFGVAIFARLVVNRRHLTLPSLPVKILVLGAGLAGIALTYGTMLGIEPGLGILLLLISLKLLETNTVRDFQVLILLGWFLGLCGLFFAQDFQVWLYTAVVCLVLIAALIRFHRGESRGGFLKAARLAATLMLQALPIVLLLFLFFPRIYGGVGFTFSRGLGNETGMSDHIEPGSVASLAMNPEPAFRVTFPDGNTPPISDLYWRGGVLWHGEGLVWTRGNLTRAEPIAGRLKGAPIRQQIVLQPHGAHWIFALDRPATRDAHMSFEPGGYLQSKKPILTSLYYEVTSRSENHEAGLFPEQRRAALQRPTIVSPRLAALVADWRAHSPDDATFIRAGLAYFRDHDFTYTLAPGSRRSESLDDFLFQNRTGFCEHYAAAFATLMRLGGIPSRIVIGYHGGEVAGSYLIVRQSAAHAWCEVWRNGEGWLRIDALNQIAPDRLNEGMESFLQSHPASAAVPPNLAARTPGLGAILNALRLTWDNLNYQWDLHVLNFDDESQRSFLGLLGFTDRDWPAILLWCGLGVVCFLAAIALWLRLPARSSTDAAARAYARFCKKLASAGLTRAPGEGPLDFSIRAATALPLHADSIRKIAHLYIQLRYSPAPAPPAALQHALRTFPKIQHLNSRAPAAVQTSP